MHGAVELCLLAGKGCDKIFIYLLLHIVTPSSGSLELPTTFSLDFLRQICILLNGNDNLITFDFKFGQWSLVSLMLRRMLLAFVWFCSFLNVCLWHLFVPCILLKQYKIITLVFCCYARTNCSVRDMYWNDDNLIISQWPVMIDWGFLRHIAKWGSPPPSFALWNSFSLSALFSP